MICLFCSPLNFSVTVAYLKSENDRNFVIEIYNQYRALRAVVLSIQVTSMGVSVIFSLESAPTNHLTVP